MQIVNKTRWYLFDEDAYTRFLSEYGCTSEERTHLTVILRDRPPARVQKREVEQSCLISGYYLNWEIHLFPHGCWAEKLNAILVHETSHYWDAVLAERDLVAAATLLSPDASRRFVRAWKKWRWSDEFFEEGEVRARAAEETCTLEVISRPLPVWCSDFRT